jgi:ubiquinone/menaquinone biosynthesis C-methylase UbiE
MQNFKGTHFVNKAPGFSAPTQLPDDPELARQWQEANKAWWEATPMRYDWREGVDLEPGSAEYFREIDERFFSSVRRFMPWRERPFDNLIDFDGLRDKDVLEIGVGMGSHAQLIAPHAKSYTGIDLTEAASSTTRQRLALFGIDADIRQMDAEQMAFEDASFDFVWSWGVIHHSSNTRAILGEMHRVLRPGGHATVMVYYRSWFYYVNAFIRGVFRGQFLKFRSINDVMQASTDGAIARFYRPDEWRELCKGLFEVETFEVTGLKSDPLPIPAGGVKRWLETNVPDGATRFMTDRLKMGSLLIVHLRRT